MILEVWIIKNNLKHRVHVATISQIFKASVSWTKSRNQNPAIFYNLTEIEWKIKIKVCLSNTLLSFLLLSNVNTQFPEMVSKLLIQYIFITYITVEWGLSLWCHST